MCSSLGRCGGSLGNTVASYLWGYGFDSSPWLRVCEMHVFPLCLHVFPVFVWVSSCISLYFLLCVWVSSCVSVCVPPMFVQVSSCVCAGFLLCFCVCSSFVCAGFPLCLCGYPPVGVSNLPVLCGCTLMGYHALAEKQYTDHEIKYRL